MIYTFEATFRSRINARKKRTAINIHQFYFMRKRAHVSILIARIASAYKTVFLT